MGMIKQQIWYDLFAKQLAKHFGPVNPEKRDQIRQHFVSTGKVKDALIICLNNMEAYANAVGNRIQDKSEALEKQINELKAQKPLPWFKRKARREHFYRLAELRFRQAALIEMYQNLEEMEPAETLKQSEAKKK
jgi:hypothetical protein